MPAALTPSRPYTPAKPMAQPGYGMAGQAARNTTGLPANTQPYQGAPYQQPAATPANPAAPNPAAALAAPQASALPLYDYTTDPILQQVQANAVQARADAETNALAAKKQLAIQYGDPALAGLLGDENTSRAVTPENDPYGVFNALARQQPLDQQALDENLNKQNLFYGGARIVQQGQLADKYAAQRATETGNEQNALQGIESGRLSALLGANDKVSQAQSDAYGRYLTQLLANPPASAASPSPAASPSAAAQAVGAPDDYGRTTTVTPSTYGTTTRSGGTSYYQSNAGKYGKKPLL